jgi:hypothetical protein
MEENTLNTRKRIFEKPTASSMLKGKQITTPLKSRRQEYFSHSHSALYWKCWLQKSGKKKE